MVQSGLVDIPAVSHYRLAAHLGLAFLIMAVMLWLALSLGNSTRKPDAPLFAHGCIVFLFVIVTICWGAFTAGLDGGLIYNDSFPKMGKKWIPPEAYQSLLNSPAGVQFVHRWLAMLSALMVLGLWIHAALRKQTFPAMHALAFMIMIQFGLGLATLFSHVYLPIAVLHQAGALTIFMLIIASLHRLSPGYGPLRI
jgi:cytochrome c oxidase assembly protein subunit 15